METKARLAGDAANGRPSAPAAARNTAERPIAAALRTAANTATARREDADGLFAATGSAQGYPPTSMSSSLGVICPVSGSKPPGVMTYMSSTWNPIRPGMT